MGFIRNIILLGIGYIAYKLVRGMLDQAEASRVKAKAKPADQMRDMPRLKLDPTTGVYKPEA